MKFKEIIETTKGKVMVGCLAGVVVIGGAVLSQYPMSAERAHEKYCSFEDMGKGLEWLEKEFDGKGLFGKKETKVFEDVLQIEIDRIDKGFESAFGGDVEDCNSVKITGVDIENEYSTYANVVVNVKNGSDKNVSYIKVNLFYYDANGNVVGSNWTNDTGCVKPNASQKIEKMVKNDGSWSRVSAEIADIRFE